MSVTTPSPIELVRAADLSDRAPYTHVYAAVADDVSRLIFTAGACPLDKAGETVAIGDVEGQAEQVTVEVEAVAALR